MATGTYFAEEDPDDFEAVSPNSETITDSQPNEDEQRPSSTKNNEYKDELDSSLLKHNLRNTFDRGY